MGLCWYLFALSVGDGFSLICEMVTGFVIIFGLIFLVGVLVSQVGEVVIGAQWVDVLRNVSKSEFVGWFFGQFLWLFSHIQICGLISWFRLILWLICLVWIDFCVVGVVFVMGWEIFKGISINPGLKFFFSLGLNLGLLFVPPICSH